MGNLGWDNHLALVEHMGSGLLHHTASLHRGHLALDLLELLLNILIPLLQTSILFAKILQLEGRLVVSDSLADSVLIGAVWRRWGWHPGFVELGEMLWGHKLMLHHLKVRSSINNFLIGFGGHLL